MHKLLHQCRRKSKCMKGHNHEESELK